MSRIGLKTIKLPEGVTVTVNGNVATVKGAKGTLEVPFGKDISVKVENGFVNCSRANDIKTTKQAHGSARANINNAVMGVSAGYKKELEIRGIGYRAAMKGNDIQMNVGFSHPIIVKPEPGVKISCKSATEIIVEGIDKRAVGQTAALIRNTRPPEPYQGKGVRYKGEFVAHKEGKRAATGAGSTGGAK